MKSFYHFLMKFRHPAPKDDISEFANNAYVDHSFPKNSKDYEEVSSYLELNGHYLPSMQIFDQAWETYLFQEEKNKNDDY
ncbi:MAG: YozE family protein [Bacillus sp. (in: firmicutes)]